VAEPKRSQNAKNTVTLPEPQAHATGLMEML
jgi:hypothetical protein